MKLYFPKDAFYNGELLFKAGQTYEVTEELGWAMRWIKRGATEVVEVKEIIETPVEAEQTKAVDVMPVKAKTTKKSNK